MDSSIDLTTLSVWLVVLVSILEVLSFAARGQSILRSLYLRTPIGRRRSAESRLLTLLPGVQIGFFVSALGPFAFKNPSAHTDHYTFVDEMFYVDAVTDKEERVLTYSVTTRDVQFRPRLWGKNLPDLSPRPAGFGSPLGDKTFAELCNDRWTLPIGIIGNLAARRFAYFEAHYYGNPGHYQTYLVGISDAGPTTWSDDVTFPQVLMELPRLGAFDPDGAGGHDPEGIEAFISKSQMNRFRSAARPNCFVVTSHHFTLFREGLALGPDADRVRTMAN